MKGQAVADGKRPASPVVKKDPLPPKKGRWDDDSSSDEEKKKKKEKKQSHVHRPLSCAEAKPVKKQEAPLVTVAMPDSNTVVDDYYASHPLMELPPEEEPMEDVTAASASPSFIPECIRSCRSVNKYKKLERLNEGSYGVVYKAQNVETGEIVALKRVSVPCRLSQLDQVQQCGADAGGLPSDRAA